MKTVLFIYIMLTEDYSVMNVNSGQGPRWAATDSVINSGLVIEGGYQEAKNKQDAVIKLWKARRSEK